MNLHLSFEAVLFIVLLAGVFVAGTLLASLRLVGELFVWRARGWSVSAWVDWLGGGWGLFVVGCLCLAASWAQGDDVFLADETVHIALIGVCLLLLSPFPIIYAFVRYSRAREVHATDETPTTVPRVEQPDDGVWPPPPTDKLLG